MLSVNGMYKSDILPEDFLAFIMLFIVSVNFSVFVHELGEFKINMRGRNRVDEFTHWVESIDVSVAGTWE